MIERFEIYSLLLAAVCLFVGGLLVLGAALAELDYRLDGGVPALRRFAGMEPK
jgi:hypothetical protein